MRSILRCFAAFAGAGFYESDLKIHQFAFEPKTLDVFLIDAPRSFRSGLAEFYNKSRPAYQRCDGVRQDYMMTMAYVNRQVRRRDVIIPVIRAADAVIIKSEGAVGPPLVRRN